MELLSKSSLVLSRLNTQVSVTAQILTINLVFVQRELLTEHIELADGNVNTEQMMSLVHVLHRYIETNIARLVVRDVTVAFHAQAIIDVHCDFMTYKPISVITFFNAHKYFNPIEHLDSLDLWIVLGNVIIDENFY